MNLLRVKILNPRKDAEAIGALVGKLHHAMKNYSGKLIKRDKYYYIDRYIDILKRKQYPKSDEFSIYGDALWEKVKDLPRGYCHGDMYCGNIHKTPDEKLYVWILIHHARVFRCTTRL